MKKRVGFLNVNKLGFLPYSCGTLQAFAQMSLDFSNTYDFAKQAWYHQPIQYWADYLLDCDMVFASCYVWNFNSHLEILKSIKRKNPKVLIVLGGPQVPRHGKVFLTQNSYIDILVHGEGEQPFLGILKEAAGDIPKYWETFGVSYQVAGEYFINSASPDLNLNSTMHSPYLMGYYNESIDQMRKLNQPVFPTWETNRGCPYGCSFCDWGNSEHNKIRVRNMEVLQKEIDYFSEVKIDDLCMADANFGMIPQDLEIASRLVSAKEKTGYPKTLRVNFAKNSNERVYKISKLLNESGMLWATTLSQQSLSGAVLRSVNRTNLSTSKYFEVRESFKKKSIPTYTELILPLPGETKSSFKNGFCDLIEQGEHEDVRVYELSLLPNAAISKEETRKSHSLKSVFKLIDLNEDGNSPDRNEIVYETSSMNYNDYIECWAFAMFAGVLHHGYYLRLVSEYFRKEKGISYFQFYEGLFAKALLADSDSVLSRVVNKLSMIQRSFIENDRIALNCKIDVHEDLLTFLTPYNPKRKQWTPFQWCWLYLNANIDDFFLEFANSISISIETSEEDALKISDLLSFQKQIILTPDYSVRQGKNINYLFNWPEHFNENKQLLRVDSVKVLQQEFFGPNFRFKYKDSNLVSFTDCAIGKGFPHGKAGHFRFTV